MNLSFNEIKLIKKSYEDYELHFYVDKNDVEFASEFDNDNELINKCIKDYVCDYIKKYCPNARITIAKVLIGSLVVMAIPCNDISVKAASSFTNYTVKKGDTLWNISKEFDVPINEIRDLNNLSGSTIYPSQVLKIPKQDVQSNIHRVISGDTLYKISRKYNVSINSIKNANNLIGDRIYIGQELIIPQGNTYTVKSGDTLWKIANTFNITVSQLKSYNGLTKDAIFVGDVLKIPPKNTDTKPSISYRTHYVKSGENLWTISIDYGIPMSELMKVNGFNNNTSLQIGQKITIPVHHIPIKNTPGSQYGEYLDWWTEAQYVFPINKTARVIDFKTGKTFMIKRTIGANHADCEPLTSNDTAIAKNLWGGFSWKTRAVIIEVDGRRLAASMSFMPHDIQYINNNNFNGHFDIHFLNSTRHSDGRIDSYHQDMIKVAAGIS